MSPPSRTLPLRRRIAELQKELRSARRDVEFHRGIADRLAVELGRARQRMERDDELRLTLERLGELVGWRTS
ncbi:MAG: hypothetical protein ACKO3N_03150 [Verrucomicrobiota bacterium]